MRLATTGFACILLLIGNPVAGQPADELGPYSEVRLLTTARADLEALARAGVQLDHVRYVKTPAGPALETVLNASEVARLAASGLPYEVRVEDLQAAYAARPAPTAADLQAAAAQSRVTGFDYGSMGGYYTFDEVVAKLDAMRDEYPELITEKFSIGTSHEGRELWAVKISDNPDADEDEPEVLYTALHHAREPQSMAGLLYYMFYLLEHYGTDPDVTALVQNRELFFVPVLNPDGYVYNETTNPGGGGYWRKNRRANGGSYGVDLNRNYGYRWGHDDWGSSPSPSSETYRGPAPFSEPETQALRDFVISRDFKTGFNCHTYGNVLYFPWGYTNAVNTPDHDTYAFYGAELTRDNGYLAGPGTQPGAYVTNGDADDWMYGEQVVKDKVFSFTPEIGNSFWPSQAQIIPLAEQNLTANLTLARLAGPYLGVVAVELTDTHAGANGHVDPGEPGAATVTLRGLGQSNLVEARARLVSTDPELDIEGGAWSDPFALESGQTAVVGPISFSVGADAPLGLVEGLALEIEADGTVFFQPLGPVALGTPLVAFEDNADTTDGWDTGSHWGLTTDYAVSLPSAFADSPTGAYPSNANSELTLQTPLDVSEGISPLLRFHARWDIEDTWDFVQVLASTNGTAWTPLAGRYTTPGSGQGRQPFGEPGYDGTQTAWVEEQMDLSAFAGEPELYLKFRLRSDGSVQGDGFFVDDIRVEAFANASTVASEPVGQPMTFALEPAYPNPFSGMTRITFSLPESADAVLSVYDVLGRQVVVLQEGALGAGPHRVTWDGRDAAGRSVAAGVYVIRLQADRAVATHKVLVVR